MSDIFKLDRERRKLEQAITDEACKYSDLVPDDIGRAVIEGLSRELEDMSKGRNIVEFDCAGRPHVMVVMPNSDKMRYSSLSLNNALFDSSDSTLTYNLHEAFIVDGSAVDALLIDKYKFGRVAGVNYPCSLYGLAPAYGGGGFTVSPDGVISKVVSVNGSTVNSGGTKIHMLTLAEYKLFALLAARYAFQCHGNTSRGRDDRDANVYGKLCGYNYIGQRIHTANGSGSMRWYSDGSPFGVSDLVGGAMEWISDARLKDGELQKFKDNNAANPALTASDFAESSSKWMAIGTDGAYHTPTDGGTENCYKFDYTADVSTTTSYMGGAVTLCTTMQNKQVSSSPYWGVSLGSLPNRDSVTICSLLRILGFAPLLKSTPRGTFFGRNTGARAVGCGGYWGYGSYDGLGCMDCNDERSNAGNGYSARSASYRKKIS